LLDGFIKKSTLTDVVVPSASTIRVDMTLSDVAQVDGIDGPPVFDFLQDIRSADINETTGIMNVSMSLSNYAKEASGAHVAINVNDVMQEVPSEYIVSTGESNSYTIRNFPVQLRAGTNVVYGVAFNPDGEFDYTRDQSIEWRPVSNSTLTTANIQIEGCDINTTNSMPINCVELDSIAFVQLFDQYGNFVNYLETNTTGAATFTDLSEGNYTLSVISSDPDYGSQEVPMPILGHSVENINIPLIRNSDVIAVPEFDITSIDMNSTNFEVDTEYTATVNITTSDENLSGYTYSWSLSGYDENNTEVSRPLPNCITQECVFSVPQAGWSSVNVDVNKSNVGKSFSQEIYIQEITPDTPPTVPGIPTVY